MASLIFVENGGRCREPWELRRNYSITMGKSKKPSKGYLSTFVPDYRLETMGESDGAGVQNGAGHSDSVGFGSSGRIDAELTASEDSCAPMRKSMSLNVDMLDRSDALGIPFHVLSIANMSRAERRALEKKLRMELELVRGLQRKIASRSFNGVALSYSSDVRSWKSSVEKVPIAPSVSANGKGKSTKKAAPVDPPDLSSGKVKNRANVGKSGGRLKRGPSGRFEAMDANANKTKYEDYSVMKQCETLLKRLMTHQFGWVFNVPVDAVKLNIPDYFLVIKHPMDLGTIKSALASGRYASPHEFAAAVRLTFSNAMTYNPPGNDVHLMADTLNKFFEVRWKAIEKKISAKNAQTCINLATVPAVASEPVVLEQSRQLEGDKLPQKKRKISDANNKVNVESSKRVMTDEEKQKLSMDLENLTGDMLERVIDFLRERSQNMNQSNEDEIEIDIDSLSDDVLWTLRKLLDEYLKEKQVHQQKKAELHDVELIEVEIVNKSGFGHSLTQPCKGNEPADEDVDIGGNDIPVSSYPPVEIEKDMVPRSSKCSSSSISSSESESSSSDSESGSYSGSESDGARAVSSAAAVKAAICSGPSLDQIGSGIPPTDDESRPVSELAELEQYSQGKALSSGDDSHHQGESVPPERQVSPKKLYRAALLRSRFADTILKAREKTLDQGEKGDPEKLRREREELERQQREEKARIEAEAKAAEDAQRQAEAVAAAELKKKRELEREAARLALQKMEKTVEIDENCQFLKDLEMLQSASLPEHLPSSVDETSPDHCEDNMAAGFKLGGTNPLEQLGLYRKDDDEDEDDVLPDASPAAFVLPEPGDIEEGEID